MQPNLEQRNDRYYITETCYVQMNTHELVHGDQTKKLKGLMWKLLLCLMERHDSIVSYDEIGNTLWPDGNWSKNSISQQMSRLRHEYFAAVGVDSKALENVLIIVPKDGIILQRYYTPYALDHFDNTNQ